MFILYHLNRLAHKLTKLCAELNGNLLPKEEVSSKSGQVDRGLVQSCPHLVSLRW